MSLIPFLAMVRKDLLLFFSDRRAVIVAFAVPIFIGSFIGFITGGSGAGRNDRPRVDVSIADEDGSAMSKAIVANALADRSLRLTIVDAVETKSRVRKGDSAVGVVIPKGFGDGTLQALRHRDAAKPQLSIVYDPSRQIETQLVQASMTQHIVGAMTSALHLPKPSPPFTISAEALTSRDNVPYNAFAHAFAGMGIQFLLFSAINLGIEMLVERERGLWSRLRSAPVSRYVIVGGKIASISIVSLMTLLVSFGFAMLVFKVRIAGSVAGFFAVAIACSMMAAGFGLLVAAVGNSPKTARGVSTLATLIMVMLGGAWVPTFVFPKWLQQITLIVPVRWAVDGLDATTWRGLGLSSAAVPTLVLLGFAAVFTAISLARFRWEEA
jgi:ABC-2 type transport system permease protein